MCPGTIALVATAASAASSIGGGIAAASSANYQGQVARNNAIISQQNAGYSASATSAATTQAGLKARAADANVKAAAAANNVDVNTGSPSNVETSQRELGGLDTATVTNRGAQQVYGYESQATSYEAQSKADFAQAPFDVIGGFVGAAGDVAKGIPDLPSGSGAATDSSITSGYNGGAVTPFSAPDASLLSGPPSLPSGYSWMGGNGTDPAQLGLGS
jgi:hypothetical protein